MCSGLLLSQRRGAEEISRTAAPPCGRPVNRGSLTAAGVVPNFDPPAYYDPPSRERAFAYCQRPTFI